MINDEQARLKELEHEVLELRRTNEILCNASAFLPRRSSTMTKAMVTFIDAQHAMESSPSVRLADRGGQYISIRYTFSILVKEARIACAVSDAVSCIYH